MKRKAQIWSQGSLYAPLIQKVVKISCLSGPEPCTVIAGPQQLIGGTPLKANLGNTKERCICD
jgi:hypothetical protein